MRRLPIVTVLLGVVLIQNCPADLIRIMPMGDSITEGFANPVETRGAYRLELENMLRSDSVPFDYVGDFNSGADGLVDRDHQSVGGYTIEAMTNHFGPAVATYHPDVVLVLAGTNNHWDAPDFNTFVNKYSLLVQMISTNSPNSKIIFSTVPKFGCCRSSESYWTESWVQERNEVRIPNMNAAIQAVASSFDFVSVVDLFAVLDPETDLSQGDWVHPNINGHRKLAGLFFDEIGRLSMVPEPNSLLCCGMVATVVACWKWLGHLS